MVKDRLSGLRITLGGNKRERMIGPVWVEWTPGAFREFVYNTFFRRDGLEALLQIEGGDRIVWVHASLWGSSRPLCDAEDVTLRRRREEWGDEIPLRNYTGMVRSLAMGSFAELRCPRCLELAPLDTLP